MTGTTAAEGGWLVRALALRNWGWLALLAGASLATTAATLLLPAAIGRALDAAVAGTRVSGLLAGCALLAMLIVAGEAVTELGAGVSSAAATARLREWLAAHVLAVGPRLGFSAGDTASRVVGGGADAGAGPVAMVTAVVAAIPPAGGVVALGVIDPWLAVAFAVGLPVIVLVLRRLSRDSTRVGTDYGHAQGAIAARLLDALGGARTIAAAGTLDRERERILAPLPVLRAHGYATWRVQARAAAQGMIIAPVLQVIVLAVAGLELARHHITAGDLVAASQYALLAVGIGASTGMVARLGRARGAAARVAGLLAVPVTRYGTTELPATAPGAGELSMRGVTVQRGGDVILRGLDLTVPGGTVVALVGKSGAGKSTVAELAGRLADPDAGSVTLDGTELSELTEASLRTAVVYAFERPHLFGATVGEAIGFGPHELSGNVTRAAAQDGQAEVFINRLPGAFGMKMASLALSGGEVQRLGLARAFAHAATARLLVLDDATSSLDTVTEMLIARALTERLAGQTRLIVAHRLATAAQADLVAWVSGGRIRALDRHEALWREAEYRALFGC
jgi:ATP-binding cassette, subfamily B, bacterial